MEDDLKPLKPLKTQGNKFSNKSFDFQNSNNDLSNKNYSDNKYTNQTSENTEKKKDHAIHWIIQSIVCLIYLKIFGALAGLCGVGTYYALKSKFGAVLAAVLALIFSGVIWFAAYSMMKKSL